MESFDSILQRAAERKGGYASLEALLPVSRSGAELSAITDSTALREMTRCVFNAGFVWKIIENKWPGFEAAFHQFDVTRCAMLSEEEEEVLAGNEDIVRNATKIRSVGRNARFLLTLRDTHGGFGPWLAHWPRDEFVALCAKLAADGDRLGGQTGRFLLRGLGRPVPVFSDDVVKALIAAGVVDRPPASKKALLSVEAAFKSWAAESGRDLSQISRVLALSVP